MDTRFWGPSGWRFLHIISFQINDGSLLISNNVKTFFTHLSFVLPCKFCRYSLTEYYDKLPIPESAEDFSRWMYDIHNCVNGKLRSQKLLNEPNPKWSMIQSRYKDWVKAPCNTRQMLGWDFLYAIAYTTPSKSQQSTPMPDAPKDLPDDPKERNRWNVMSYLERRKYLSEWWKSVGYSLPFENWRKAWSISLEREGDPPLQKGKKSMIAWLYRMETNICQSLSGSAPETVYHSNFEGLCSELYSFSSGCGVDKSKTLKTCRAIKEKRRKTHKKRRSSKYKAVGGFL